MKKTSARFYTRSQVKELTSILGPSDTECLILPLSALKQPVEKLSRFLSRWSPEAILQFKNKLKELDADEKDPCRTIRIHLSTGAVSVFLFIDPKVSAFELHQEMRKAFEDVLAPKATADGLQSRLHLNLLELDKENSNRCLLAISILCETSRWKPVQFGHRTTLKKSFKSETQPELLILSGINRKMAQDLVSRGTYLGEANNLVRTLADLPANELTPSSYKRRVADLAKSWGLEFEYLDCAKLTKRKAGAFLAVARADLDCEAGIACVRYRPKTARKGIKSLALIGKGICFDTGGYNVKTGGHMLGMHGDMTGSAIALALCGYYASIKADFEVRAYLALAENLISPTAYKPNEVVIACDGTSIEVVDTDAEGRMVLADTLAIARLEKPTLAIDFATLTGAAIRALDTRRGAVFSNRRELAELAVRAGDQSGERAWSFPLGEDYRRELKSKVADILQCAPSNNADHIYAATFLSHFIGDETPWIHLDLVPAENKGGLGLISSDTTGFGILWAEALIDAALGGRSKIR